MLSFKMRNKFQIDKRKIVVLFICINLIIWALILPINHYTIKKLNHKNGRESTNPIISASDIDIITPENKTYSAPMSGYYPATHGFESDKNGDMPFGWTVVQKPTLTNAHVINEIGNHKKLIRLNDDNSTSSVGYLIIENNFEQQAHGTIECWVRITDISQLFVLNIRSEGETVIKFYLEEGKWMCRDGAYNVIVPNMTNPVNNRWYHVQIDFECSASEYKGLFQYTWKVSIDGRDSGILAFYAGRERSYLNYIALSTGADEYNYDVYIDAIGYSWYSNYQIGDNFNEGLLLSFVNSTPPLEWIGNSLDHQSNNTIQGNTTISFPEDGIHTIQVFGNNSVGTNYESDIRYFIIDTTPPDITINSPNPDELFGEDSPNFDISIDEAWLNDTWYNLNNGELNYFFDDLSGKINQTEWDKFSNGTVTIDFYCNDSIGFTNSTQVTVRKDILAPIITITSPYLYQIFNETPSFRLEIIEGNLDSMWYSLDGGQTNTTFTGFSGTINEYLWDGLPEGEITIKFYAKDTLQHESYKDIIVVKELPAPIDDNGGNGDGELPFEYWIIIISSIVGVALAVPVLIWYIRRKKPKEFF